MRVLMSALIGLFLLTSLTGCSESIVIRKVYIEPPSHLLQPIYYMSAKEMGIVSYGDLVGVYVPYLKTRVGACTIDKLSIVEYIESVKKEKAP
jgi:hypothetical protein